MSDSGWKSPGTVVDDAAVGTVAWTNPDNAKASDDSIAEYYPGSMGEPTLKLIKLVIGGSVVGNSKSNNETLHDDELHDFGGSTDTWGNTLSVSDINSSSFGVVLQGEEIWINLNESHYLKATNFGFSVPSGATIDGVIVQVEGCLS